VSVNLLMKNRCTVRRAAKSNVDGVIKVSFCDYLKNQRCLLQEKRGRIETTQTGQSLEYEAVCYLPVGTDIKPRGFDDTADQIVMTKPATGTTFSVMMVADSSGMGNHLKAYLRRTRGA
jgi:hypothetical protein